MKVLKNEDLKNMFRMQNFPCKLQNFNFLNNMSKDMKDASNYGKKMKMKL